MDIIAITLLSTLVVDLGLGIYILSSNWRSSVNRTFSAVLFCLAQWSLFILLGWLNRDLPISLSLVRSAYFGPALMASFFVYFSLIFPRKESEISWLNRWLIFAPGIFIAFLSQTPFVLRELGIPAFFARPSFGFGEILYIVFVLSYFSYAFWVLARKFVNCEGRPKLQIFYVLFGMVITVVVGSITSLLIPAIFKVATFASLGPAVALIMGGCTTYALVRYKLLDIEDFLTRGIIFFIGTLGVVGTFVIVQFGRLGFIPFFYLTLFNFVLGSVVYFQNRKSPINVSFSAIIFIFALWALSIGMFLQSRELGQLFFWSRLFYLVAILIPSTILYFTVVFPTEWPRLGRLQKFLIFLPTIILVPIVFFSKWMIAQFIIHPDGIDAVVGPLYSYYFIYYALFIVFAFFNLLHKYRTAAAVDKIRIRYVFWGLSMVGVFASIFNVILPWMGNYRLIWVGPYSVAFLSALIAYAIVVHRLMSIEVVIQRAFVYAVATGMIMALYAVAVLLSEQFFRGFFKYSSALLTGLAALIIAIIYQPLVRGFQNLTDHLFFRGRYDYQKTLREISHKIASVIRFEDLTYLIVSTFINTMRISEISFLIYDKGRHSFKSLPVKLKEGESRYKQIEISQENPLVKWLAAGQDVLVFDELEDEISKQEIAGKSEVISALSEVKEEMAGLGVSVWVPIIFKDELVGIISLGNKLSGDIFTSEDCGLLTTLANQTAMALENAKLYDEVVSMKNYNEKILQSMVSGVLTVDRTGFIITFNPMVEKITGVKAADAVGRNYNQIFSPKNAINMTLTSTLKGRTFRNFETSILSQNRGLVPVSINTISFKDVRGKISGVLLTLVDLTEVKELESKVRQADKLGALATMAAGMAHEIKNPLSSMKVLSQLLPIKYKDSDFRGKFIEIMPREINRIDRIVESLLGFARATSPKFEKLQIRDVIEENVKYFADQAKKSSVKILKEYAKLPQIEGDAGQLSQVFSNLILNAIQAMPEGGKVTIKTKEGKKIENILQNIVIQVSDTGHGIPKESLKKLFDPFFTTKYAGTGLGLTISHSIVEGHRGYISADSLAGKGTFFTITLPVSQELL